MKDDFEEQVSLKTIIELLVVTGGQLPLRYINFGHIIRPVGNTGIVGGYFDQIFLDQLGRLTVIKGRMNALLGCGHVISSAEEMSGFCQICAALCCKKEGCLEVCDFLGITVCRRHYEMREGVIVSSKAQKGLWKRKAKKIAAQKRELLDARRQIPKNT